MKEFFKKVNQSTLIFDILLVMGIFFIGLSLANYFGSQIHAIGFGLGWISCVLLLLTIKIMEFYSFTPMQLDFDHKFIQQFIPGLSPNKTGGSVKKEYSGILLLLILIGGWAVIQFVLLQLGILAAEQLLWLFLLALFAMLLGMPALHLVNSGYADLLRAMLIFGLLPVYAYQVISGEFHLLMILMCMPMTLFYLALHLVNALYHYQDDQINGRQNFLQKVGWKRGMFFHNIFILLGFVSFACMPLFGYSPKIFLNPLIVLPVGLVLIFMLFRIENGKKPEWESLIFLEKILMVLIFYFLFSAMILQ